MNGAPENPTEASIQDVADRAQVSVATVSRVLNGTAAVRDATRERVLSAVAELGYRPNLLAANLRKQKAQTIGVVVSDIENPHFTALVRGVEDAAQTRDYRVVLCNTDERADKQRSYLELLSSERVSGVILAPCDPAAPEIGRMLDLGIPIVAVDRSVDDPRADFVGANNAAATRLAVEHLLATGRHRIALVNGPLTVSTGKERAQGYEQAIAAAGLDGLVANGGFRVDGGRQAIAELHANQALGDAIVFANNLMAIGGLQALHELGLRVPVDVAVVAVDDPFWAELVDPPLTTLAQPVREMAQSAVAAIFERISRSRRERVRDIFDFELRVRGSCGAGVPNREA